MAGHLSRPVVRRRWDRRHGSGARGWGGGRDGSAVPLLGTLDCVVRNDVLHGRAVSSVEGKYLRGRTGGRAAADDRAEPARSADAAADASLRAEAADS